MQIIDLNKAEMKRAEDCAYARNQPHRLRERHGAALTGDAVNWLEMHFVGAQGEIAVAKLLGIDAPLDVNTFRSKPDLPPNWSVKTAWASSAVMRDGMLRIRQQDWHPGWRHVLVERDRTLDGDFVFVIHGYITDEDAKRVARQRWENWFVPLRHLQPIEPLCQLDEDYWAQRAERWMGLVA